MKIWPPHRQHWRYCGYAGIVRTQIQLPDDVFTKANKLCEARELSLNDLTRRGIESMLSVAIQKTRRRRRRVLAWVVRYDFLPKVEVAWVGTVLPRLPLTSSFQHFGNELAEG